MGLKFLPLDATSKLYVIGDCTENNDLSTKNSLPKVYLYF